jgi:hypothetical protein
MPIGATALPLGKKIGDQRDRRRREGCFAQAHQHAEDEQGTEALGQPATHRGDAPQRDAADDQIAARQAVSDQPQPDAGRGVKGAEGDPLQQADLYVAHLQIGFDRIHHHVEDGAVDDRYDRRNEQQQDGAPCLPSSDRHTAGRRGGGRGGRHGASHYSRPSGRARDLM